MASASVHGRTHYGLRMAAFLPYVLLHPRWQLRAVTPLGRAPGRTLYLTDEQGLVSHLHPSPRVRLDPRARAGGALRGAGGAPGRLVREMGLILLGANSVMIPGLSGRLPARSARHRLLRDRRVHG